MEIFKALTFLEHYPNWIKLTLVSWIVVTAFLVAIFIYFYQSTPIINADQLTDKVSSSMSINQIDSSFQASKAGLLELNCSRYRSNAHLNIHTLERRVCESLSEIRSNMNAIRLLKEFKEDSSKGLPKLKLNLVVTKSYFRSDFTEIDYGPRKEKIEALIVEIIEAEDTLNNITSISSLHQWEASSQLTLDDLFIAFGFLDWIIGFDSKGSNNISPSEFFRFGPFFNYAFSGNDLDDIAVIEFNHDGDIIVDYVTILSSFD